MSFPFYKQPNVMDCGPTCLKMIASHYGKSFTLEGLRHKSRFSKEGVSLLGLAEAAESIGFRTSGVKITFEALSEIPLPAILLWNQSHFVVLLPQSFKGKNKVVIADPSKEIYTLTKDEFLEQWHSTQEDDDLLGVALLLEPTAKFYEQQNEKEQKLSWRLLYYYLRQHKTFIIQLVIGLIAGSLLQLIFPYLTQSIVDKGINGQNLQFIYIILVAQLMLFFSRTIIEFIRGRILLHLSTRINISILSDFWIKLMHLPMGYFDTKMAGDTLQRIGDHKRIESFLTGALLDTLYSLLTLVIFSFVLLMYNYVVFFIFSIGSILYVLWITVFMRHRRQLDHKRFSLASKENTATMQLIYGMQEIKLHNAEQLRRWEWEGLQAGLFKLNFKSLSLSQYQQFGAFFLNEGKNILITFFVAQAVVKGQLTLGAMMAVQYIIGQLNAPVQQLIGFMQQAQDAKISMERLNEIHQMEEEEPAETVFVPQLPENRSIWLKNLSFTYPGAGNEPVLRNINLSIPEGKTTAIVGMSGSGKTTILKLLLRFYEDYEGDIKIGDSNAAVIRNGEGQGLKHFSPRYWRDQCGCVMQEGYIFNDNIIRNIVVNLETVDYAKLTYACRAANILEFIESLPLGFNTRIGAEGNGISQGQKQRILIARVIYKNPEYLFFDEATNALDADNEKVILENLQEFFKGKTVVVVAHRLSTVKNADNIIVLHKGEIVEQGSHRELTGLKGSYYHLVKNQLELGT